jgi:hypothetical protein
MCSFFLYKMVQDRAHPPLPTLLRYFKFGVQQFKLPFQHV